MSFKTLLPLLALTGASLGWQHKTEAEVRDALKANEHSLVAFVAPSTAALEKHWSAVEDAVPTALSVDCSTSPSLCAEFDVASYPAIRLYRQDGTKHHYRGPRKASEITAFVRRMLRPAVAPLDSKAAKSFNKDDDVVLIAHMAESETNLRERFAEMAGRYRDRYAFGLTTIEEAPGRIACYNNADGAFHMTSDLDEVDSMEKMLKKCASQLVPRLTRRNEAEYLSVRDPRQSTDSGKSLTYFFSTVEENLDSWTLGVKPLAKQYHEYITFVTVDLGEYPDMPALFGLPADAREGVAVYNPAAGLAFPFKGEKITVDAVAQHIADISEGNADAWQVGDPATDEEIVEQVLDEVPVKGGETEATGEVKETTEEKVKTHDEL
ncbi:hypothetical protein CORC01_10078 [Colletotrichum orchidophilum]|uniref:Protein disulfide-isomerase n=1 Tax=Colletotrichum orchidophilum TaxID=1209926 RepID=A0A1G4AZV4_9PEZI|nr:uncharacterized protein CORC01_10078 [Colletotrichum orchidophilum]OHE94677.1 hypothetical protein CORC01_10078 [Colletotrichum orchidophilum]